MKIGLGKALVTALGLSCFGSAILEADFLIGGVTIVNGSQIHSNAGTTRYKNNGSIAWDRVVEMSHTIINASTQYILVEEFNQANGQTNNNLSHPKESGLCYQAWNDSMSWPEPLLFDQGSSVICPPPPCGDTPILLDLGLDGFQLSSNNPPVEFDLDADGVPSIVSWTAANSNDAFLCLDRNSNGLVDDGRELFGNATPLRGGEPAGQGFKALAELDLRDLGGNEDKLVDARDRLFASLCAWIDVNRDGRSQKGEIAALSATRVLALEYDFALLGMHDKFGNLFWLQGNSWMSDGTRIGGLKWPTYDVIFDSVEDPSPPDICDPQ